MTFLFLFNYFFLSILNQPQKKLCFWIICHRSQRETKTFYVSFSSLIMKLKKFCEGKAQLVKVRSTFDVLHYLNARCSNYYFSVRKFCLKTGVKRKKKIFVIFRKSLGI